eukprot:gene7115-2667_t
MPPKPQLMMSDESEVEKVAVGPNARGMASGREPGKEVPSQTRSNLMPLKAAVVVVEAAAARTAAVKTTAATVVTTMRKMRKGRRR